MYIYISSAGQRQQLFQHLSIFSFSAFKAVSGLPSASAIRDAPRTPNSLRRTPEICSSLHEQEPSLTHPVLTSPGQNGKDGVNVSVATGLTVRNGL